MSGSALRDSLGSQSVYLKSLALEEIPEKIVEPGVMSDAVLSQEDTKPRTGESLYQLAPEHLATAIR